MFLHDRYASDPPPHLHGWWSNSQESRFRMAEEVELAVGADSFRLCNPPPWLAVLNMASLEVMEAGTALKRLNKTLTPSHRSSTRRPWTASWTNSFY